MRQEIKWTLSGVVFGLGLWLIEVSPAYAVKLSSDTAQKLITKSGCFACHAIDTMKIGPAYKDVAAHYRTPSPETTAYLKGKKPIDYLMEKVRAGTKPGVNKNWIKSKDGKPYGMMTPNPASRISDADLHDLIEYILSLK